MIGGGETSFRAAVLRRTLAVLAIVLAICLLATTLILQAQVEKAVGAQARQRALSAAQGAVPALLVARGDLDEAARLASALIAEDVLAAELWIDRSTRVAAAGQSHSFERECVDHAWPTTRTGPLQTAVDAGWCVSTAVIAYDERADRSTQVGALKLVVSDNWATQLRSTVLITNAAIWIVGIGMATWLAFLSASRTIRALTELAELMGGALEDIRQARAPIAGPKEIAQIASTFNALVERLGQEQRAREQIVEARTRELRGARDRAAAGERYKASLMAGISHEMRTPLHVIQGYAKLAQQDLEFMPGTDSSKADLKIIQAEASQLLERVDELLRYCSTEAGSHTVKQDVCDLAAIAAAVQTRCETTAATHGNELSVTASDSVVMSDRELLTQIASNLANNACKFTRQGSVRVVIGYEFSVVSIAVIDDGPGFNRQLGVITQPDTIVEPLQEQKRFRGMGLGLGIVTRFVELLGGILSIESTPGTGTVATALIPAKAARVKEISGL